MYSFEISLLDQEIHGAEDNFSITRKEYQFPEEVLKTISLNCKYTFILNIFEIIEITLYNLFSVQCIYSCFGKMMFYGVSCTV